jgi:membrane-associated protease RseP (regulator of RpoE activity)
MTQDAWRELIELKQNKNISERDQVLEGTLYEAEAIVLQRNSIFKHPWLLAVMLGLLLLCLTLFCCYAPYLQRQNMIQKIRANGEVKVGTDVPQWINEYAQGELNDWFPVINAVHLRNQEVPDYMLDYLLSEKEVNQLGFSNCTFETPDKLTAFAQQPELRWMSIVSCQGTDFKMVDKMKSINPKLNINYRGKTFLGVMVNSQTQDSELIGIQSGSPADVAGLKCGDVIRNLAGKPIKNFDNLLRELSVSPIGEPVILKYERAGEVQETQVVLAPWPVNKLP